MPTPSTLYRVPRTRMDDRFTKGDPLPYTQVGAGSVLSVDADGETATVDLGEVTVDGIVVLGLIPEVDDWVEVWSRGDLLVIPETAKEMPSEFTIYVQPDEPLGVPVGTLWFDTDEVRP